MTVYTQTVNIGSSFEQTFVYTLNDQPVNLTGWGAVFRLRDESDSVISTVRYGDTGDRSLTIDGSHGTIDVTMVASATSGFTAKTGTFELEIYELINTGRVFRIVDGAVRYRPRGRAMLDNTVCVIRSTTNQVTVETQNISQYQRIDRGPPGAAGVAALNESAPAISEDPAVGSSGRALRLDAQYGLALSSRHGFMRKEDKGFTDNHQRCQKFVMASGDTTGATDTAAFIAALTEADQGAEITLHGRLYFTWPGSGTQCFDFNTLCRSGVTVKGSAVGRADVNGLGAHVTYVGPRVPGLAIFGARSCTEITFKDFRVDPGVAEIVFDFKHGGSGGDSHRCRVENCPIDADLSKIVVATSSDSWTPAVGSKLLTISSSSVASKLPAGSQVLVVSRTLAPNDALAAGTVTSCVGNQLTVNVTEVWSTLGGSHSDWDIITTCTGIDCSNANYFSTDGCTFTYCWHAGLLDGNEIYVGPNSSSTSCFGYTWYTSGGANKVEVNGGYEPTARGRCAAVRLVSTYAAIIAVASGDEGASGWWVDLQGCDGPVFKGGRLGKSTSNDALIRVRGCTHPVIIGGSFSTSGGAAVDFTNGGVGISINPFVNGAVSPGGTLVSGAQDVDWTKGTFIRDNGVTIDTLITRLGFTQYGNDLCGWTAVDLGGANLSLGFSGINNYQSAGASPTLKGIAASGYTHRYRVRLTTALIVAHQFTVGTNAIDRIITPSATDETYPAGSVLEFAYDDFQSRWLLIPLAVAARRGSATLASGTVTVSPVTLGSDEKIMVVRTASSGTSLTVQYAITTKTPGHAGSFVIQAQVAAGTINTADASTLDWAIV